MRNACTKYIYSWTDILIELTLTNTGVLESVRTTNKLILRSYS